MGLTKANTFLLGVQKAGTTSLFDWISQHPDVFGPVHLKDFPFFSREDYYKKGSDYFAQLLGKPNIEKKITIVGATDYTKDIETLRRIYDYNSASKVILILRNPVDRAISAFKFMCQMGKEVRTNMLEAFKNELQTRPADYDLCYLERGRYSEQVENVFSVFGRENSLVLLFDELANDQLNCVRKVYTFLNLSLEHIPNFTIENVTGKPRVKFINKLLFTDKIVRKLIPGRILDILVSPETRTVVRRKVRLLNTKNGKDKSEISSEVTGFLVAYYAPDIKKIESILDVDTGWLS